MYTATPNITPSNQINQGPSSDPDISAGQVKEKTHDTKEEVRELVQEAREKTKAATEKVKEQTRQATEQVKHQAEEIVGQAREQGISFLDRQKHRVASELGACSEAARRAAERLTEESDTDVARYVTAAADRFENARRHLEQRNLGELIGEVENFARRRPEIVFGSLFVAGLAAGRFLKASGRRPIEPETSLALRSSGGPIRYAQGSIPMSEEAAATPVSERCESACI